MTELKTVENFCKDHEANYLAFLGIIKSECQVLKDFFGIDYIADIKTRGDVGVSSKELKSPNKILQKLKKKGSKVTRDNILKLSDIIGITIVVQYSDYIPLVIERLVSNMKIKNSQISLSKPKIHSDTFGYYATHITCKKKCRGESLNCEIQIKTMLHNAWATKMHDLTYKPQGTPDSRLNKIMQSVSQSLDAIELQSSLLRDMIHGGRDIELVAIKSVRQTFFEEIFEDAWHQSPQKNVSNVYDRIEKNMDTIPTIDISNKTITSIQTQINKICDSKKTLREGWWLAAKLACYRDDGELLNYLKTKADSWLTTIEEICSNDQINDAEIQMEIRYIPLVFYTTGSLDEAIDCSEKILDSHESLKLSNKNYNLIKFNLLGFIIDKEYLEPTRDTTSRKKLKDTLEKDLNKLVTEKHIKENDPSYVDTYGFLHIAFAENTKDVKKGIKLIETSERIEGKSKKETDDGYKSLYISLGWHRYVHLYESKK